MHFDTLGLMGRRRLLTAGLAVAAVPVLAACAPETVPTGNSTAAPRQSAVPGASSSAGASTSSSASASTSTSTEPVKVSSNIDDIKVEGKANTQPKVTVPTPWGIDKTRVKVLDPGKGATVPKAGPLTVQYYGVNGRTGESFDSSWSRDAQPATFSLTGVIAGFAKGLAGQQAGSRVLIAVNSKDGYDPDGNPPTILPGDTLIFVVDILSTVLDGPEGEPVAPIDGLPTVEDKKGVPTITMPKADPPPTLQIQPLIKGTGAEVTESDTVFLHYRGALWADGKVVDDNFGKDPESTTLGATLIPGFTKGIIGQTVGSRVLIVIPPADGYPEGNATPSVPKDATLVYVVDVLFAQAAS